jgi:hypothetical protein
VGTGLVAQRQHARTLRCAVRTMTSAGEEPSLKVATRSAANEVLQCLAVSPLVRQTTCAPANISVARASEVGSCRAAACPHRSQSNVGVKIPTLTRAQARPRTCWSASFNAATESMHFREELLVIDTWHCKRSQSPEHAVAPWCPQCRLTCHCCPRRHSGAGAGHRVRGATHAQVVTVLLSLQMSRARLRLRTTRRRGHGGLSLHWRPCISHGWVRNRLHERRYEFAPHS